MKSPKERQRAYREQRKEHKNAGLTKLKILASATTVKRLDILSEIDNIDVGNVLGQAVELIWTQRFGNAEIAPAKAAKLEKPEKEKAAKLEKPEKPEKSEKPKTKSVKPKGKSESENPILAAKH
jgi:hypothetical protein